MKKYTAISIGLAAIALAFWFWPREVPTEELPVVDIDVGEPMVNVMDRSTYDFRFKIMPPIWFSIPLAAYESERDGYYFLRLRNGDQSVQFPWFPAYADINVTTGQTEEMKVRFFNYPIAVPENRGDMNNSGGGGLIVPDLAAERQAMIDIYFMLDSLKMKRLETACYPEHPNRTPPCENHYVLPQKEWSAEELGAEFDRFVGDWQKFWAKDDPKAEGEPAYDFMIARWISNRGAVISMSLGYNIDISERDIPISEREKTFVTQINIQNLYDFKRAQHIGMCFGNLLETMDSEIRYTLEQARVIYGTILDKMGPLRDDNGAPITDPVVLNSIMQDQDHWDSDKLIRNSWGEVPADADRGKVPVEGEPEWCAMVKELEQDVGYEGP